MSFEKLSFDSLRRVRTLLTSKFPKSAMMLNIFDMTLNGMYPENDNVKIYGYNGIPDAESMFLDVIIKAQDQKSEYSVIYAPEHVTDDMMSAFSNLHDWTKGYEFGATPVHFAQLMEKLLVAEKGGTLSKGPADDMYLPVESALKLEIERENLKEDFELDKLSPVHAAKVNSHWKYGSKGHDKSIADAIRSFGGAGVFKKAKDSGAGLDNSKEIRGRSDEDLVSWVFLLRLGTLNALHTLDEHRNKGLGQWTMEAASKWLAQEGLTPLCEIEPYNKQSKRLMEKIGFKFIQEVWWMQYTPLAVAAPVSSS